MELNVKLAEKKEKHRCGLQLKFVLGVVVLSSLTLLLFSILDQREAENFLRQGLETKAHNSMKRFSGSLSRAVWQMDDQGVREILVDELYDDRVLFLYVSDLASGKVLAGVRRGPDNTILDYLPQDEPDALVRSREVRWNDKLLGSVTIGVDTGSMRTALRDKLMDTVIRILLLEALLILSIFVMVRRLFIQPIRCLSRMARRLSDGATDCPGLPVAARDELGDLIESFNHMRRQIAEREQRLRARGDELEKEVQDRTADLLQANERLRETVQLLENTAREAREADKSKSAFLANMSHEIRTPMNAIIGLGDLLLNTELSPKQEEYARSIRSAARSLLGIINDILDFSKIEAGKLEIEQTPFSLRREIEDIQDMFRDKGAEKDIEFVLDIAPDPSAAPDAQNVPDALLGDPRRLRQVLVNLIGNAYKFTHRGEICLRVRHARTSGVTVFLDFSVSDTGIGMRESEIARIFEAFTQADDSISRLYGGTGLGLSITQSLVKAMGGDGINVRSQLGAGSVFTFSLPFVLGRQAVETGSRLPESLAGLRALVVDDSETGRQVVARMLESFGLSADMAASAEQALAGLRTGGASPAYGLVVMDRDMPGLDGLKALERLRADPELAGLPVIMMASGMTTDKSDSATSTTSPDAPGDPALLEIAKPVKQSALLEAVYAVCGRRSVAQDRRIGLAHAAGLTGKHVLLVEDNGFNRQVAMEMLEHLGATVDQAENGRMAVEAVRRSCALDAVCYDFVLMDVRMPELDGFQATAEIRRILPKSRLPIIAMTAHAMTGDRERCLAAGMNDYISKPIDIERLYEVLVRNQGWRRTRPGRVAATASFTQAPDAGGAKRNFVNLDAPAVMRRLQIELPGLLRHLRNYRIDQVIVFDRLKAAASRGDLSLVGLLAHSMAGAAANIAAEGVRQAARALEGAAATGNGRAVLQALAGLETGFGALMAELRSIGPEAASGPGGPGAPDTPGPPDESGKAVGSGGTGLELSLDVRRRIVRELDNLSAALSASDPISASGRLGLLRTTAQGCGLEREFAVLSKLLEDYDFDLAGREVEVLRQRLATEPEA